MPPGVINIVTGDRNELTRVLVEHDDVDGVWYFDDPEGAAAVEYASAGNMKRTWTRTGNVGPWLAGPGGEGEEFLHEATQVKNIWCPYGA